MTYRKGDLPKIIILVVLIAATACFSIYIFRGAAPAPAKVPVAAKSAAATAAGEHLFAPREHSTSDLLLRAQAAPDPFKPYVTQDVVRARPVPAGPGEERTAAAPAPASRALPPIATEDSLRLVGIVSGSRPMAVLVASDGRYYARPGDLLPTGWRLARLTARTAELTKGKDRRTLTLTPARQKPSREIKPLSQEESAPPA